MINMLLYQILASTIYEKILKSLTRTINLTYQLQNGIKNLNYLMDHVLYQIVSRLFWINIKKHTEKTDNSAIRICVNKIENRITFKTKRGYYLELLTPETMKLLGGTKSKMVKNENSEIAPNL